MSKTFAQRIQEMNQRYDVGVRELPGLVADPYTRNTGFIKTLREELDEGFEINCKIEEGADPLDVLVDLADWFGDMIVYIRSEAMKYGIPLEEVLDIIMDSNESKLGADGQPIKNENGKFLKGPNYWAPEAKIKALLLRKLRIPENVPHHPV